MVLPKESRAEKINGFFGLIGPDINVSAVSSLYELFTGNGVIQGIFFDKGNLTYIKHYVRTEKIVYEEEHGVAPNSILSGVIFHCLHFLNLFPNMMGLANTALLEINNNIYAMFERDNPYLIKVDFVNKLVKTIEKINFKDLSSTHFSGHTKYINNKIKTIDYNVAEKCIYYYSLSYDFKMLYKTVIKTEYLPIIHDFLMLPDSLIVTESPILLDIHKLLSFKLPITFYKDKKTKIHLVTRDTVNTIEYDKGFYIFHYADYKETDETIEIFASLYDDLDFSRLAIKGNYRKITIHKKTNTMTIERNPELETYDLDFPIKVNKNNLIVLRNIDNFVMNGFVICDGLKIVNKILFTDIRICGEPALIYIENKPHLLTFAYNETMNYIVIIDIETLFVEKIEIPLQNDQKINIGFHSIFVKN